MISINETATDMPRRLFVAFEGGGAKALVHIGALKVLEDRGFDFRSLSGTSAGAIIAALKAVGYSARDIVDPDGETTILHAYNQRTGQQISPAQFFNSFGKTAIRLLKWLFSNGNTRILIAWCALALYFSFIIPARFHSYIEGLIAVAFLLSMSTVIAVASFAIFYRYGGFTSARRLRNMLNDLFAHKLFPEEPGRVVVLGDLAARKCPSLHIVAADISNQRLRLFSSDSPSDAAIPIADVVTASICIPFLFTPWQIGPNQYLDGGLVSNLPAWPFDEERELDADAVTVAFEIGSVQQTAGWLLNLIATTLYGSAVLNKRAVPRLEVINLKTDLGLLDFDCPPEKVFATVAESARAAEIRIIEQLEERPRLYREASENLRSLVRPLLAGANVLQDPATNGRVRAAFAFTEPNLYRSLRLQFCAGFEDDADEDIILPRAGTVIGEAYQGDSVLMTPPFDVLDDPGLRRLNKLFAKDIRWIFAKPIYLNEEETEIAFVVAIDGSDLLLDDDHSLDRVIDLLSEQCDIICNPLAASGLQEGI